MKKIINQASDVVNEMIEGFVETHKELLMRLENTNVICKRSKQDGLVAIISGGGSGHEPAHAGFVGEGMLNAAVCGYVFTAPTPDQIYEAIVASNQGAGVLLIVKNYSGDIMNFEMAKDMAEAEDISVEMIVVDDDIAVENSLYTQGKRGVAGTVFVHKIIGAAAQKGYSIQQLVQLGKEVIAQVKTIGVALSAATLPEVGKPGFELSKDEMEYGVGIHSEPGYRREKIKTSHEIAVEMIARLKQEFKWSSNKKFAILVNGLGGTPLMEQYIFVNDVLKLLKDEGIEILYTKVGDYMTSIDMCGISLTMLHMKDETWLEMLTSKVHVPTW